MAEGAADKGARGRLVAWIAISVILFAVGCGKPIYTKIAHNNERAWAAALTAEVDKRVAANVAAQKAGIDRKEAIDFGRQLDSVTSFYETVITVLLATLGVVTALAVWTIRSLSRAQAEEAARAAVLEIIGGHADFKKQLSVEVQGQVDLAMEVMREELESGGGLSPESVILNPKKGARKPHFVLRTPGSGNQV